MNDYDVIVAQAQVDGAHMECPYSKVTHGNINVVTNAVEAAAPRPEPGLSRM
jgi:organic hydroperoxide reductase OsmC/OhrA